MQDFFLHMPTQIFFGPSKLTAFAEITASLGIKALLVTGGGSVERLGYLGLVSDSLSGAGIELCHFAGIEPNPLAATVNQAADQGRAADVQFVIALGGGSVMDAAKAIAALLENGDSDIWPYVKGEPKFGALKSAVPVVAIPTTAATASEVTPYSVISKPEVNGKSFIAAECLKPYACWINPVFTLDVPRVVTQDGAADIFSHVLENYITGGSDAVLSDRYCEAVMLTVLESLPALQTKPNSLPHRSSLAWCSTLALNGLQQAGRLDAPFPLHMIEHALSGYNHELAHGRGLATLFPAYFQWLWENGRARDRIARLGTTLFGLQGDLDECGRGFMSEFSQWLIDNELYQSLEAIGIDTELFEEIAAEVVKIHGEDGTMDVLGPFTKGDIVDIFELTESQVP